MIGGSSVVSLTNCKFRQSIWNKIEKYSKTEKNVKLKKKNKKIDIYFCEFFLTAISKV